MDSHCDYNTLTPDEVALLMHNRSIVLLDVRTPREYHCHRIPGVILIPISELSYRYQELDASREIICICEHGMRSETAAELLAYHHFPHVSTMSGGMVRWRGPLEHGSAGHGSAPPHA